MRKATQADLDAKLGFIEAYFDDLRTRIDFLKELHSSGHGDEAMLLCCCYIDGLATYLYWPDTGSHQNFVRAVKEFSPHHFLARIHARQLLDAVARLRSNRADSALPVLRALEHTAGGALQEAEEIERFLAAQADDAARSWILKNLWRGTLASIAYEGLRVPSVHSLGSAGGISFSTATLDGEAVPDITFEPLWATLEPMYDEARKRSLATNQWFGHDLKTNNAQRGEQNEEPEG